MKEERIKVVLVLGANSDVAKQIILLYLKKGFKIIAASRNTAELEDFLEQQGMDEDKIHIRFFDAVDYSSHKEFYENLPYKPNIVVYAAGFLKQNLDALKNWEYSAQMMQVNYCGAVSILNIIAMDSDNHRLEKIIGISSLSGVRGRKSNFIYGSTKAAFTQYLAGLRQHLAERKIIVNVIVSGYIRTKINAGLDLPESLVLEPEFVAKEIIEAGKNFTIVPGLKWKGIYMILKLMPEGLVARLP